MNRNAMTIYLPSMMSVVRVVDLLLNRTLLFLLFLFLEGGGATDSFEVLSNSKPRTWHIAPRQALEDHETPARMAWIYVFRCHLSHYDMILFVIVRMRDSYHTVL